MREIKFKAKRIDNGRWIEGRYFTSPLTDESSGVDSKDGIFFLSDGKTRHCIEDDGCVHVIDRETLCQAVGVKDKDEDDIFESDILEGLTEYSDDDGRVTESELNVKQVKYIHHEFVCDVTDFFNHPERTKIVGNVHDVKIEIKAVRGNNG